MAGGRGRARIGALIWACLPCVLPRLLLTSVVEYLAYLVGGVRAGWGWVICFTASLDDDERVMFDQPGSPLPCPFLYMDLPRQQSPQAQHPGALHLRAQSRRAFSSTEMMASRGSMHASPPLVRSRMLPVEGR